MQLNQRGQSSDVFPQLFAGKKPGKKRKGWTLIDSFGQSSDVFRLLVGAVMGLAILLIVLGIIQVIEQQKFELSQIRFVDGFEAAVNLPANKTVKQEQLLFRQGTTITAYGLAKQFPVDEKCIVFFSGHSAVLIVSPQKAQMTKPVQTDVFFNCAKNRVPSCDIDCKVGFGAEPP